MCAYAMRITDLDPLQHGLIFERFLNPERMSMPDFDVDFDERRRGEVIRYVTEKYGDDRVAQIVTYGTIKAKQAIKDSAPGARLPVRDGGADHQGDAAAVMGKDVPLSGIFDPEHKRYNEAGEFRQLYESDPEVQQGRRHRARAREPEAPVGRARGRRDHVERAADRPRSRSCAATQDGQIITQFDYPSCETLGLVKMDFLGLRNLTILDDALKNIEASRGITLDLDALETAPRRQADLRAARPR